MLQFLFLVFILLGCLEAIVIIFQLSMIPFGLLVLVLHHLITPIYNRMNKPKLIVKTGYTLNSEGQVLSNGERV